MKYYRINDELITNEVKNILFDAGIVATSEDIVDLLSLFFSVLISKLLMFEGPVSINFRNICTFRSYVDKSGHRRFLCQPSPNFKKPTNFKLSDYFEVVDLAVYKEVKESFVMAMNDIIRQKHKEFNKVNKLNQRLLKDIEGCNESQSEAE